MIYLFNKKDKKLEKEINNREHQNTNNDVTEENSGLSLLNITLPNDTA